jgi:hypothetical protein
VILAGDFHQALAFKDMIDLFLNLMPVTRDMRLRQEPVPEKIILPAEVIDQTNHRAWLIPIEQRTCPEWSEVAK